MRWHSLLAAPVCTALIGLAAPRVARAQPQSVCIPGTGVCAQANGRGGVQAGGIAQGQVGPGGASATANANASANANANANAQGNAGGPLQGQAQGQGQETQHEHGGARHSYRPSSGPSVPVRFGTGVALCATIKAGIYAGVKGGPCLGVSFRWETIIFEMETQLLFGGVRHSADWVFPMSFVVPLTSQRSLYEGLQLRVGGSPIGVTFAKTEDGGSYVRFGLHAGLSYEWDLSGAVSWRVFDARTFLDFGTRREVDLRHDFLDFGGQLATGIVF
jgi:hypothetical protein